MDAAPYYAPTYFPASYFYSATAPASGSTPAGPSPYNAPTYFAPSYFFGPPPATTTAAGLSPYNAPTYFAPSYFYGPTSSTTETVGLSPYNAPTYFAPSYFHGPPPPTTEVVGPSPYNAPTYFAPSYFHGSSSSATGTGVLPYNAPTYFASSYFYGMPSTAVSAAIDPATEPEVDPFLVLLALLEATGAFEGVIFGAATRRGQAGADTYPLAVLTPRGWEESDDYDPTSIVRRVTFSITVVVKTEDDLPRFEELDRLSNAVKKALDRSSLDGRCLPGLTRIRSGHFDYSTHHPEQSIELEGEFSTIIIPPANVPATS